MPVPVDETEDPAADTDSRAPVADEPDVDQDVLVVEAEDRWAWRRGIRADPRKRAIYRFFVGLAGGLFILAGLITGPLPGPGGIPLVLLGLAIWASEFHWAHRLMTWFKSWLAHFRGWSRPKQTLFWVVFFTCCGLLGWLYLVVLGVPTWMPHVIATKLDLLPGV